MERIEFKKITAIFTRQNDPCSPYISTLKTAERIGSDNIPRLGYSWSDFVSHLGRKEGGFYSLFDRVYATPSNAIKATQRSKNIELNIEL